jgi:t-SNARE complex subunit (syntaxin)
MNDYNQVQLGYRQKCKERIQRQLEISELVLLLLLFL